MDVISVNQFRDNLKTYVEQSVSTHTPIKVSHRAGDDFIVMSAEIGRENKKLSMFYKTAA